MKKYNRTAAWLLMGMLALLNLASCSNEEETTSPETDELAKNGVELTYRVDEASDDSIFTRATVAQRNVESQTFMGMEVETEVTDESLQQQTRTTVYNTVDLNGKTVSAFVFDPATNKTIANKQTVTIQDGKLTVKGKVGCKILFYIGGTPYANAGTDISTIKVGEQNTRDAMQCVSGIITGVNSDLGTLSFKHVFSKIRVILKTSNGSIVNAFSMNTKEKMNYPSASVSIADRTYTASGTAKVMTFAVSGNTTATATAPYQNIIADPSGTPTDLSLVFANSGKGATIDGVKNYLTDVNNTLTLRSRVFQPGHRYSINITVRPSDTEASLNSGFKADRQFYQWDAYEPFGVGDAYTWSAGNSGTHPFAASENGKDIATQCAKDCPSLEEMKMYLGAGVLADDGHTGANQPSFTIIHPVTGEKTTYHTGVWLKKKQYIEGFSTGTAPKATTSLNTGRPSAETINQYFFLPLNGFMDMTNGIDNVYLSYGITGYFMSKTSYSSSPSSCRLHVLSINAAGARLTNLNWKSGNICSVNIWTAD